MGFFTWTLANRQERMRKDGDYAECCKLKYDGPGYVICPDGSVIVEHCYEGYGVFDNKDVYELVVDWNKGHLVEILKDNRKRNKQSHIRETYFLKLFFVLAKAIDEGRESDCPDIVAKYRDSTRLNNYLLIDNDWKRRLGIQIACNYNDYIPFPIKITDTPNPRKKYDQLRASHICQ